jgi:signal transduction histidine kinase
MRLDAFLKENRAALIERCRAKVSARRAPRPTDLELERGIPLFLDQLIETLRLHLDKNLDEAGVATQHGKDLLSSGFTVAQVVHDYGDVCQSVTDLAIERGAPISNEDFRTLNRCLDDAIAAAVTEFSRLRDLDLAEEGAQRLGILAHEVRNIATSVTLAFDVVKSGRVGVTGATAKVLERSLARLNSLVARSLTNVRLESGNLLRERVAVAKLFEEIEIPATLSANAKGVMFSVAMPAEPGLAVEADAQIVSAILVNLVQNAVKFTHAQGHVVLSARAEAHRVLIDVTDECGGLPPGGTESLFRPYTQRSKDRSGVGLGLMIAQRGAEAHGGKIHVRDLPGTGCVFTVELPRIA